MWTTKIETGVKRLRLTRAEHLYFLKRGSYMSALFIECIKRVEEKSLMNSIIQKHEC